MPLTELFFAPALLMHVADNATIEKACAARKSAPTKIEIVLDSPDPEYDFSKNVKQLTAMSKSYTAEWGKANAQYSWAPSLMHTNGLTRGQTGFKVESQLSSKISGVLSPWQCPHIRHLKIRITYNSVIYVASDFKKGSCDYKEVWNHEHKHHNANLKSVKDLVATLQKEMPEVIAFVEKKSVTKGSGDKAMNTLGAYIEDAVQFYTDKASEDMAVLNAAIDTPEEYRRAANACGKKSRF